MMYGSLFSLLTVIPVLVCQWTGVILLRRSGRGAEWWLMLAGTLLTSVAAVASPVLLYFTGGHIMNFQIGYMVSGGLGLLGSLSFGIGFAIHGAKLARRQDRVAELEMLSLAQATELQRLRDP